jgi:hypothetical protein
MARPRATLGATRRMCSGAGMAHWQDRFLGIGELPPELSIFELEFFQFSPREVSAIRKEFRPKYRIAVALQLGFMRMTGARLNAFNVVPRKLLNLVGEQVGEKGWVRCAMRCDCIRKVIPGARRVDMARWH